MAINIMNRGVTLNKQDYPEYLHPLFDEAERLRTEGDKIIKDVAKLKEDVSILNGERGDATKSKSAVRRSEMYPLGAVTLTSKRATGAPTQADFNALQADVDKISRMLLMIAAALGHRPK